MKTIDSRSGTCAASGSSSGRDLNVPLDGDGRSPTTAASAPRCRRSRRLAEAGARVVVCAHLGRPKGAPEAEVLPARRSPQRLGELLGRPVAFADRHRRRAPRRPSSPALEDGDVALLENLRFNAGETTKDDAERGAFADELAALADVFVSDGFGVVHRKQASVYDVARAAAARRRRPRRRPRSTCCERLTAGPRAAVRRGARRRQGRPTSSASSATCSAPPTGCSSAAAWSSPSSRPRATRSARACSRPTRSTRSRATSTEAAERGRRDRPAGRHRRRRRVLAPTPTHDVVAADAIPADRMGLDIGPESARLVRRAAGRRAARSSGTARWACSRWRRTPRAPAPSPRPSSRSPPRARSPSSAVATPRPPCASSASRDDQFGHISTGGGASLEYLEGKAAARPDRSRGARSA